MFTNILIATCGEKACRVIATARMMGIKTLAGYSDAAKETRHVVQADKRRSNARSLITRGASIGTSLSEMNWISVRVIVCERDTFKYSFMST